MSWNRSWCLIWTRIHMDVCRRVRISTASRATRGLCSECVYALSLSPSDPLPLSPSAPLHASCARAHALSRSVSLFHTHTNIPSSILREGLSDSDITCFDRSITEHSFVSLKVFMKLYCTSRFAHKVVNLFFISVIVKDKLTDLLGSLLLHNDL